MNSETLVKITTYAKMCGVTYRAIERRIATNAIEAVEIDGMKFIDFIKYPPAKRIERRRNA